jgi:hypothetical protein
MDTETIVNIIKILEMDNETVLAKKVRQFCYEELARMMNVQDNNVTMTYETFVDILKEIWRSK